MDVRGRGVVIQGNRTNGVWNWTACQFNYGDQQKGVMRQDAKNDRSASEPKIVTVIDNNDVVAVPTIVAEQKGFWGKTANFATRTLAGSFGAAIPFAVNVGANYLIKGSLPNKAEQFCEMGLFSAGIGLASATFTNDPDAALTRGMQFGSVVVITQKLGKIEEGKAWETARNAANAFSTKTGEKWSDLKDWTAANVKEPICKWSGGGKVGNLFGCAKPEGPKDEPAGDKP